MAATNANDISPDTSPEAGAATATLKEMTRRAWSLGDYHRFAVRTVWEVGPVLVDACGIGPGQRVLDVAAGTGNVAIRAAEAGADVVASDLTPENFEAGRREAAMREVDLVWREGDAEALPFEDATFDVVTSNFGAIFAHDHRAVADELVRVCRPGGTIGLTSFRPVGTGAAFFDLMGRYGPPLPPAASPPLLWGEEDHVRRLLADRVSSLEMRREAYVERSPGGPDEYRELFTSTFGPVIATRQALQAEPERLASFDRELEEFTTRWNRGMPGGPAEYPYDYLLIVARKAR